MSECRLLDDRLLDGGDIRAGEDWQRAQDGGDIRAGEDWQRVSCVAFLNKAC